MEYDTRHWQHRLMVTVFHGPRFGHYMEMERAWRGREECLRTGLGQWSGLGIPEDVMRSASGLILAAFEEHLITRYGVQGELPMKWSGEADLF